MRCLPGPPDGRMVGSKQLPLYRTGNLPELRVETRPAPPRHGLTLESPSGKNALGWDWCKT